jgi:hypothetical protein
VDVDFVTVSEVKFRKKTGEKGKRNPEFHKRMGIS